MKKPFLKHFYFPEYLAALHTSVHQHYRRLYCSKRIKTGWQQLPICKNSLLQRKDSQTPRLKEAVTLCKLLNNYTSTADINQGTMTACHTSESICNTQLLENLPQCSATYFRVNEAHLIHHSSIPICLSSISSYSRFMYLYLLN